MTRLRTRADIVVAFVVIASTAAAQSREVEVTADASTPAASRAVAQEPGSPDAGFIERMRRWVKTSQIVGRLNGDVDGWYPRLGGLTRGGGFGLGPGFRDHVWNDRVLLDVSAAISTKAYKAVDAKARWYQSSGGRAELWTNFRVERFPQEDFFGIGNDTTLASQTSYARDTAGIDVRALFNATPHARVGAILGYMDRNVGPGSDREFPSTENLFSDLDAPGLLEQPNYVHATVFGEFDGRDAPGNPHSGGVYRASFGIWDDRTLGLYSFRRFDAEAEHNVPLVAAKTHVLVGRIGLNHVNNAPGDRVPFYFLATVGGANSIRSYRDYRFQDENALWMNAEYHWTFVKYATLVGFVDAGEVRHNWNERAPGGLRHGYGFGVRGHTSTRTLLSFDVGTGGGEGTRMFVRFTPSF